MIVVHFSDEDKNQAITSRFQERLDGSNYFVASERDLNGNILFGTIRRGMHAPVNNWPFPEFLQGHMIPNIDICVGNLPSRITLHFKPYPDI